MKFKGRNTVLKILISLLTVSLIYTVNSFINGRTSIEWEAFAEFFITSFPLALTIFDMYGIYSRFKRKRNKKNSLLANAISKGMIYYYKDHPETISIGESDVETIKNELDKIYSYKVQYLYSNGKLSDADDQLFHKIMHTLSKNPIGYRVSGYNSAEEIPIANKLMNQPKIQN